MDSRTKFLILFSFLAIVLGFSLIFLGFNSQSKEDVADVTAMTQPESSIAPIASQSAVLANNEPAVAGIEGERAQVTRVVDGDTIDVDIGGVSHTIRFLEMDTPETVDPRKPVQCFGKEASNETKKLLTGKTVILQKDVTDTDIYKRLLRFIYLPLPDGSYLFVNDYLVREGFARPLTIPPDAKFSDQFAQAAKEAREAKKGLWGKC